MKKSTITSLLALVVIGTTPLPAAERAATVTEAVNQVSHGSSQSASGSPAKAGTTIRDGEYVKTGSASRAELQLSNQTITRLGANTIFNYSAATNEVDLQAGTMLFSKPKDGKQLNIKTASVTAAIVGTTGFAKAPGSKGGVMIGLIEGKATLTLDGKDYTIHAGEILWFAPGQPPQIFAFDIPRLLKSSQLLTKFKGTLPNQKYIDEAVDEYNDLVDRGFIRPPKYPFFVYNPEGDYMPYDYDSVGNRLDILNTPPREEQPTCSWSYSNSWNYSNSNN